MATKRKRIPVGRQSVTPYLIVKDAGQAIDFYKGVFNATEIKRIDRPDGRVMHAEIRIGDSCVMICDENLDMHARSPSSLGGTPVSLYVYVEDVDEMFEQAIDAGAIMMRPVDNQFYGDRCGTVTDPFGHLWHLATHQEDVEHDELQRRADTLCQKV
jgi:PhnB protein